MAAFSAPASLFSFEIVLAVVRQGRKHRWQISSKRATFSFLEHECPSSPALVFQRYISSFKPTFFSVTCCMLFLAFGVCAGTVSCLLLNTSRCMRARTAAKTSCIACISFSVCTMVQSMSNCSLHTSRSWGAVFDRVVPASGPAFSPVLAPLLVLVLALVLCGPMLSPLFLSIRLFILNSIISQLLYW